MLNLTGFRFLNGQGYLATGSWGVDIINPEISIGGSAYFCGPTAPVGRPPSVDLDSSSKRRAIVSHARRTRDAISTSVGCLCCLVSSTIIRDATCDTGRLKGFDIVCLTWAAETDLLGGNSARGGPSSVASRKLGDASWRARLRRLSARTVHDSDSDALSSSMTVRDRFNMDNLCSLADRRRSALEVVEGNDMLLAGLSSGVRGDLGIRGSSSWGVRCPHVRCCPAAGGRAGPQLLMTEFLSLLGWKGAVDLNSD